MTSVSSKAREPRTLDAILSDLSAPKTSDISTPPDVPLSAVYAAAKKMADIHGYIHTRQSLEALHDYLKGFGLFIYGDVGTGKTFFFESVGPHIKRFSMLAHMSWRLEEIADELEVLSTSEIVIDDIGNEPVYNNFGVRLDLFPWLLEQRLDCVQRTHFTSNLNVDGILGRYENDARIFDRIKAMAKIHHFQGQSHRTPRCYAPSFSHCPGCTLSRYEDCKRDIRMAQGCKFALKS